MTTPVANATARGTLVLTLLQMRGIGPATTRKVLRALPRAGLTDLQFVLDQPRAVGEVLGDDRIDEFVSAQETVAAMLHELAKEAIEVVVAGDSDYPERLGLLGNDAPLSLMLFGDKRLLSAKSIGFCGSRSASDKALSAAQDLTEQLCDHDLNVVSGYAAGVDTTVHMTALAHGGTTTIVLPLGISHFAVKRELHDIWDAGRVLVMSQFPTRLPWKGRNAMRRNGTICALSNALVVVEADITGGTIEAGKKGLELGLPVFALDFANGETTAPGNAELVKRGARWLGRDRRSHRANVSKLLEAAAAPRGHPRLL